MLEQAVVPQMSAVFIVIIPESLEEGQGDVLHFQGVLLLTPALSALLWDCLVVSQLSWLPLPEVWGLLCLNSHREAPL